MAWLHQPCQYEILTNYTSWYSSFYRQYFFYHSHSPCLCSKLKEIDKMTTKPNGQGCWFCKPYIQLSHGDTMKFCWQRWVNNSMWTWQWNLGWITKNPGPKLTPNVIRPNLTCIIMTHECQLILSYYFQSIMVILLMQQMWILKIICKGL